MHGSHQHNYNKFDALIINKFLEFIIISFVGHYFGVVLVLHTPIIKYIFSIICITVGKNGKENKEGLKTLQLSTIVVTLLLHNLPLRVQFCLIS